MESGQFDERVLKTHDEVRQIQVLSKRVYLIGSI